jgi:AbrB family looped-hinge helix DNA binding protein
METSLDKFGRVVIPKEIRDDLGLEAGAVLTVEAREREILLRAAGDQPAVEVVGDVLVYTGKATANLKDAVRQHREHRMRGMGAR